MIELGMGQTLSSILHINIMYILHITYNYIYICTYTLVYVKLFIYIYHYIYIYILHILYIGIIANRCHFSAAIKNLCCPGSPADDRVGQG